jgi:hypothetical protein
MAGVLSEVRVEADRTKRTVPNRQENKLKYIDRFGFILGNRPGNDLRTCSATIHRLSYSDQKGKILHGRTFFETDKFRHHKKI